MYGQFTFQELRTEEDDLIKLICDSMSHFDNIFNKIFAFQDLCVLTSNDKIDKRQVLCLRRLS